MKHSIPLNLPWRQRLQSIGTIAILGVTTIGAFAGGHDRKPQRYFQRVATFPVFQNSDIANETVAEIVTASKDGNTLIYTDSALESIGFVDIKNPAKPLPLGILAVEGEPTSVAVAGRYALAAVVTDDTYTAPAGQIEVIDIATRTRVATLDLGGQPDAISISPDGRYAAVIIENQRDEDLGDGRPGQPGNPPGKLVIVDLKGNPTMWTTRDVALTGIADLFPEDPEPEFVDINRANIAVVTMQENNHIVLVDLRSGKVIKDFPAGTVDLDQIDATEDDVVSQTESLTAIPREPDAVQWINDWTIATADEGDLDGGSRGFTFFNPNGSVIFSSANGDDHLAAQVGHYPEDRSENKGNEPEGIEYAKFGSESYVFVGSERASMVSVYSLNRCHQPEFKQVLPTGLGPEGLVAIPHRNLLVVASENDSRGDGFRATISIYQLGACQPSYPTIVSTDRADGTPIPWSALSALAADPSDANRAWSIEDSFYKKNRIFALDLSTQPAVIDAEIRIQDSGEVFKAAAEAAALITPTIDPAALRNADGTVNIDPEGLARNADGDFWIASEGNGTVGDAARPIKSLNWLFKTNASGEILNVVSLPADTNASQSRFGLEGIASVGSGADEVLFVCFQREWKNDPKNHVRIGRYAMATGEWSFFYYPINAVESPNGGWVGLSEIVATGNDQFLVVERDNQAGPDARIKKVYSFSTAGLTPLPEVPFGDTPAFPVVTKTLVTDLMPALQAPNGLVIEKVEGLAVLANGQSLIVTDNDGVDDSSGETQLIKLGTPAGN